MTQASKLGAAILLFLVPTIEFGGHALLRVGRVPFSVPRQAGSARTGWSP